MSDPTEPAEPSAGPAVFPEPLPERLRLVVAYDGTDFCGWARQPGLRSVQAELELALMRGLRVSEPLKVACAGRTDAGVHARGQVCHADVPAGTFDVAHTLRRVNRALPEDIAVHAIDLAPAGFDARWGAMWRRYSYRIADGVGDPLNRRTVVAHPRPLDVEAMNEAAQSLLGERDFTAFCKQRPDASSVRTLLDLQWRRESRSILAMDIRADAFCHSMVRSLVGALVAVGDGRWPVTRPAEFLAAGGRTPAIIVMPAHGLVLEEIGYPADADLVAQAERAKRYRG